MPKIRRPFMSRATSLAIAGLLCLPAAALAQMAPQMQVQSTPHYTLELNIGPAETMMMSDSMADEGMAVNHHLEVHITAANSDTVVSDVTPTIRITDKATGASHDLPAVMGMVDTGMGPSDFHYGQNVFLPDGTYLVTVQVAPGDTAVFRDVVVAAEPMMSDHSMGH